MNLLEETFGLIKSLSKNEKGYFKKSNSSTKPDSKLIRAFDILSAQSQFDEKELKALLGQEGIAKSVLRDLLKSTLKSLSNYNAGSSSTFKLNMLLSHVETLFNSKRYTLCLSYVDKGIRLASKHRLETYALQFSFWKRRLEGLFVIPLSMDSEEWLQADNMNLKLLEDKVELHHLGGVQTRILLSQVASEDVSAELDQKVLNFPILQKDYQGDSPENLFLHSGMKTRCLLIVGDLESALEECLLLLSKSEPYTLEGSMIKNHFVLRLNIMRLQAFLKHHEEYTKNRKDLEALLQTPLYLKNAKLLKPVIYPSFPVIHCAYLASKGETEYLLNYYQQFIKNPDYSTSVSELTEIEVGLLHSWSLFVSNNYRDCLSRISQLHADYKLSRYEKLNSLTKWLELLSCFEIRDDSLYQSKWNSMQHYLQVKTQSSEAENQLLKQLNSSYQNEDRQDSFYAFLNSEKTDLRKFRIAFTFIDIVSWLKEKASVDLPRI
ncbi:hypothetical protein OAE48_00430 [Flavobacteriales bacterium]|nr:hypothetical protein [Flavobacteriales bacterium]